MGRTTPGVMATSSSRIFTGFPRTPRRSRPSPSCSARLTRTSSNSWQISQADGCSTAARRRCRWCSSRSVATTSGSPGSGSIIHVPRRTSVYLYSTKNLAGSALALVGLVLFFTHVVGALWPVVVVGLYIVGVLVAPGNKTYDLHSGWDPGDVRKALGEQMKTIGGKVPDEVVAKVSSIQDTILTLLPRVERLPAGSEDLFIVQRTALEYLPTALEAYLNLPRAYATLKPVENGKTASQVLLDQLTLLEGKMNEISDDIARNDSDRLLANGRFLAEKFGRSELQAPEGGAAA